MMGIDKDQRIAYRQEMKAKRQKNRSKRKDRKEAREEMQNQFSDQMVNREGGAMWGGYRNDGKPTNPNALTIGRGRTRPKYNERRS
jgi:hypothetical protein